MSRSRSNDSLKNATNKYLPFIEEVHISSIVSRRGYLNFLDENGAGWMKRFVVCTHLNISSYTNLLNLRSSDDHLFLYTIVKKILLNEV